MSDAASATRAAIRTSVLVQAGIATATAPPTLDGVRPNLHIAETVEDDIVTLALSGELDEASCPVLADCLRGRSRPGARVVVDLRPLNFVDAAGVELLHRASVSSSEEGWSFAVRTTGERYISRRRRAA